MKNELTLKIRAKGYTVNEFLLKIGRSLRWYRTHEIKGAAKYNWLAEKIDELESK